MSTFELPNSPRLLVQAPLKPVQGHRFQPTGFPDLGAARYRLHDGTEMLLVESAQSVANRMESACWDEATNALVEGLAGVPYVDVWEGDERVTNTLLEAHRINSVYVEKSDFRATLEQEIGYDKTKPFDRDRLVRVLCKYDPNSLLHGVFLESIAGVLRMPRALSGFIEATNVEEVASGGVKNDRVAPGADKETGRTAAEGYGNVPFHRTEFTAERVDAYFNVDLAQLRSYRLGEAAEQLLYALCVFKIRAFLDRGLRLRTACDFEAGAPEVTRPDRYTLPTEADALEALMTLIPAVAKEGRFADPPVTRAQYTAKAKKESSDDAKEKASKKKASKKKASKKKAKK